MRVTDKNHGPEMWVYSSILPNAEPVSRGVNFVIDIAIVLKLL